MKRITSTFEDMRNHDWKENFDYLSQYAMPVFIGGLVALFGGLILSLLFVRFSFLHGLFKFIYKAGFVVTGLSGLFAVIAWIVHKLLIGDEFNYRFGAFNRIGDDADIETWSKANQEYIRDHGGTPISHERPHHSDE